MVVWQMPPALLVNWARKRKGEGYAESSLVKTRARRSRSTILFETWLFGRCTGVVGESGKGTKRRRLCGNFLGEKARPAVAFHHLFETWLFGRCHGRCW